MFKCLCRYDNDYVLRYAYDIYNFPYHIISTDGKGDYYKEFMTFDIETSVYNRGTEESEAFMYIWQISIHNLVIMGRTWKELQMFFDRLKEYVNTGLKMVIYVHNLSYEFEFMRLFLGITNANIFATDSHKVLKCTTIDFEFRCSYFLTNSSLARFIKDTPGAHYQKAVDDLDYKTLRTPETELTPVELGYCYNDVRGLHEAIEAKLIDDDLNSIPCTSTGYVRRDCRYAMQKNKKNKIQFRSIKLNARQYLLCKEAFRGGNTASNRYLTDSIYTKVGSYDISSSYPYVMLAYKFPVGKFQIEDITSVRELEEDNKRFCTIGRYSFTNIRLKKNKPIPYIPYAKCRNVIMDTSYNGRILKADYLQISLTNIDYDIIKSMYEWDEIGIDEFYIARKGYLPKELRDRVLHYFKQKSLLKGVKGMEVEYMQNKALLNAIYGMCVTDPLHDVITLMDNGDWSDEKTPLEQIQDGLDKYYKGKNNFLSYQWGVFVTAYARMRLQQAIDKVGMDVIYCDTDSVKYKGIDNKKIFDKLNEETLKYCKENNIEHTITTEKGKTYSLGLWDSENNKDGYEYDEFKTLGAKKYAYKTIRGIGVTVAGLNKIQGAKTLEQNNGLLDFTDGMIFNENESGRTTAKYNCINQKIHYLNVNGVKIETGSNIVIEDTTYTLGISKAMEALIKQCKQEVNYV